MYLIAYPQKYKVSLTCSIKTWGQGSSPEPRWNFCLNQCGGIDGLWILKLSLKGNKLLLPAFCLCLSLSLSFSRYLPLWCRHFILRKRQSHGKAFQVICWQPTSPVRHQLSDMLSKGPSACPSPKPSSFLAEAPDRPATPTAFQVLEPQNPEKLLRDYYCYKLQNLRVIYYTAWYNYHREICHHALFSVLQVNLSFNAFVYLFIYLFILTNQVSIMYSI